MNVYAPEKIEFAKYKAGLAKKQRAMSAAERSSSDEQRESGFTTALRNHRDDIKKEYGYKKPEMMDTKNYRYESDSVRGTSRYHSRGSLQDQYMRGEIKVDNKRAEKIRENYERKKAEQEKKAQEQASIQKQEQQDRIASFQSMSQEELLEYAKTHVKKESE